MRQKGFILLLTLIMLSLMGLLLLSTLHQVQLLMHALTQRAKAHYQFYQLEHVTRQLLTLERVDNSCIAADRDVNLSLQWLYQNRGCKLVLQGVIYYYWVEDLGEYPCIVLNNKKKQPTHHYRISVWSASKGSNSVVQVRVLQPSFNNELCKGLILYVQEGISSWRYISAAKNGFLRGNT